MNNNEESTIPVNISYNALSVLVYSSDHNLSSKELKEHKEALISVAKEYVKGLKYSGFFQQSLNNLYLDDLSFLRNHNFFKNKNGIISVLGNDISDIMKIDVHTDEKIADGNMNYSSLPDKNHDQIREIFNKLSHPNEVISCSTYKDKKTVAFSQVSNSTNALNNLLYGTTVSGVGIEEPTGGNFEDNYVRTKLDHN